MIREWLAHARAERVAARVARGERAWRRDLQQHPDELLAFRDAQIAGLRETNAQLRRQLLFCQRELATYLTPEFVATALRERRRAAEALRAELLRTAEDSRRIAEEPTVATPVRAMGRTRRDAPTERWPR